MDERNGECTFPEHHDDAFYPAISETESEHDCLKDFLLEPTPPVVVCQATESNPVAPQDTGAASFQSPSGEKNGDWSPSVEAGCSERTVSSDCVSSEPLYSPDAEAAVDSQQSAAAGVSGEPGAGVVKQKPGRKRKSADGSGRRLVAARSAPQKATYQSQISPDQNGIKLRIKKSVVAPQKGRKRRSKGGSTAVDDGYVEPLTQSGWGEKLPKDVLYKIFEIITRNEGCIPFLVRMTKVCRLWREVAETPKLWHHVDLASTWVRDPAKNDLNFCWLCENRLSHVQDLNLGETRLQFASKVYSEHQISCYGMKKNQPLIVL